MRIHTVHNRKVLVEKFDVKHEIHFEVLKMLNGARTEKSTKQSNGVSYIKAGEAIFVHDIDLSTFFVIDDVWFQFERDYNLTTPKLQKIFAEVLEDQLDIKGVQIFKRPSRFMRSTIPRD